jgi:PAS domain-containing protein
MSTPSQFDFLTGGGEMGERIRAFDWAGTPLGPPERWPPSLKAAVTICLGSRMPIVLWWDREHAIQFYNDAYISFLGSTKHPSFLGRSGRECWQEIWDTIGPLWHKVIEAGDATWSQDICLAIDRRLPREEGYFTFSYSPIWSAGSVGGIFCACYETTGKVVGARRLETLRKLGEQAMEAYSVADACARAEAVLQL